MNAASDAPDLPTQPRLLAAWYPACLSSELGEAPVRRTLWGTPLVLWRTRDGVACLVDRCPHRNIALSEGRVREGELQCRYHGWHFDRTGTCTLVPGLADQSRGPGQVARAFPVREQQGIVWVWTDPDAVPDRDPFTFRHADAPGYTTVRKVLPADGSLHQMVENALDVPHTSFLHGGLFRTDGERRPIQVVVRRWADRCEAEYIGEARPPGLAGRILSPSGGDITHHDRFYLPSIVEVEYRLGDENHLVLNGACAPIDDWRTAMFAVVSVRTRFPGWLVKLLVQPIALRIFGQDAEVLAQQREAIARFGEERYVSTEIDILGPHVLALLRRAARGKLGDADGQPQVREVELRV